MANIDSLNKTLSRDIQSIIDDKTKPTGSLGQLEQLALQLALIGQQKYQCFSSLIKIDLAKPRLLIFAGDHGINDNNLSIAPSAVTGQMVNNFLHGGAAINCFCRSNNILFNVIDCGILSKVEVSDNSGDLLIEQRLGAGTADFSKQAAMSMAQVKSGLAYGHQLVDKVSQEGCHLLLLGEMGIANTSSASAIMAALTEYSVEECVGTGTGICQEQLENKVRLIKQALTRLPDNCMDVDTILSEVGGFEIVQMVGAILAAAAKSLPVVIDGFIVSVAALVALSLNKNVADYLIYAHISQEKAHQLLLAKMIPQDNIKPLLNLGLRLGEGTGAALALPLIQAAASFYNEMASFETAGVSLSE
ncbi:nicotinate-nucleotide--dimethylbenzimidazole phosphoribosyltransferase [Candidatus Colwellia aromaticivorans]|uniref:nicotinate-nucleotide--dimethylbenzimidazole phosphoribosyltransferase n=1 Tax=Candidatus Colwellia aromaticivorans TaxID=2267621 RepID=UPI000DF31B80|nr:nicotinate-nucleotide--dimethylbenzimidazole phosphoribosyltransferase [Candidatus Colwellia aromaticivorans]